MADFPSIKKKRNYFNTEENVLILIPLAGGKISLHLVAQVQAMNQFLPILWEIHLLITEKSPYHYE